MMKRFLLFIMIAVMSVAQSSAQITLKELLDGMNLSHTDKQIAAKYPTITRSVKHFYDDISKTTTDYEFHNIDLKGIPVDISIVVDSITKKLDHLSVVIPNEYKERDAADACAHLDVKLATLFGDPDYSDYESSSGSVIFKRNWYLESYVINTRHLVYSDSHYHIISIKEGTKGNPEFRKSKWGDSMAKVKSTEKMADKYPEDKDIYAFNSTIAGYPCTVAFIFVDDKLSMAKYLLKQEHSNRNDYIIDHKDIVNLLTSKYGKPSYDKPYWKDDLYQDNSDNYGMAVCVGHLTFTAKWEELTTDIIARLSGENYDISQAIQYTSKKYIQLRERKRKAERATGL